MGIEAQRSGAAADLDVTFFVQESFEQQHLCFRQL